MVKVFQFTCIEIEIYVPFRIIPVQISVCVPTSDPFWGEDDDDDDDDDDEVHRWMVYSGCRVGVK